MRSMEVVGAGAGGGAEGSVGAHFCSHGAPRLGAGGARLPLEEEDEADAEAAGEDDDEAEREEERRRSGRRWRWGREERRKEW